MEPVTDNQGDELLQSEIWMKFQEMAGKRAIRLCGEEWSANGIVHRLPIVGNYLYVPRGPKTGNNEQITDNRGEDAKYEKQISTSINALIARAEELNVGWIRIEPETEELLAGIHEASKGMRIVKAPHDMQPRETFVVGLGCTEEELLAAMKPKTRYNIRVAEKRGVKIVVSNEPKYREAFIRLVTGTADRKGIVPHPIAYYEVMLETLLGDDSIMLAAEKEGEILAANLVAFCGDTATYLHGGSDDRFRADMAPFLLQWEGMREAKRRGCSWYDFGGVNVADFTSGHGKWLGITRFKFGFSPATAAVVFPGTYDIVLSPWRYTTYRFIQWVQSRVINVFGK